jgi:hypothetical protein
MHADHEAWLVDSGASFHMNPHKEWLCEYGRYDGGDFFLVDESTKILGQGKLKLKLMDGRIRTVPGVLHIPRLDIYFIFVIKMDDAQLKTFFEKENCGMAQGAMVILKGIQCGTLYKM